MPTQVTHEDIYAPIHTGLKRVEESIVDILTTRNDLSQEVIRYFFSAKGKLLRPALCLLGAHVGGHVSEHTIRVAAALEIFHSATLIHDDILDEAELRRNITTINAKWGPQLAVLIGDFLHDRAIATVVRCGHDRVVNRFLETVGQVCDGEILEFKQKQNVALSEVDYYNIIQRKTAVLLAHCVEAGALLAGLARERVAELVQYGTHFGMAFQIVDDCLDFMGEEQIFGKTLGTDCEEGVLTLPVIRLLAAVPESERPRIFQLFTHSAGDGLQALRALLEEHHALDYAFSKAREHAQAAQVALVQFPDSPARTSLELLLDYVTERHR